MPLIGDRTTRSSRALRADATRARASSAPAFACTAALCATSRSRSARAPPFTRFSMRISSFSAHWLVCSVERSIDCAESSASWSVRPSIRASRVPARTACPSCGTTCRSEPPISARTVASRSALSSPDTSGPTLISPASTMTMFSWPISTAAGAPPSGGDSEAAVLPQAAEIAAAPTMRASAADVSVFDVRDMTNVPLESLFSPPGRWRSTPRSASTPVRPPMPASAPARSRRAAGRAAARIARASSGGRARPARD